MGSHETCPTCGGRTIFTTRPCGGDEWNEYYRGADCRDPFHPWNEGPDVGDDDPACTCRPLGKATCIKHATPTPPAPADDASGAEAMRVAAALDKVAKAAGYERAWVAPSGEPNIILERKHPTSEGMIQVTRLDLCVGARDHTVEEAARALIESVPPDFWNNDPPTDDTEVAYAIDYALLDALRAALRRAKGGDK